MPYMNSTVSNIVYQCTHLNSDLLSADIVI